MSFEQSTTQEQEQPTGKVRELTSKSPAPTAPAVAQTEKLFVISEASVNQLLTAIAKLKGLDWETTNPLMLFIQQSVKPLNPPSTS